MTDGTRTFEYKDDKSSKFWEINQTYCIVTVRYGKAGTKGQNQEKVFADLSGATKHVQKLISEKISKGYQQIGADSKANAKNDPAVGVKKTNARTSDRVVHGSNWAPSVKPMNGQDLIGKALKKLSTKDAIRFWKNKLIGPSQWMSLSPSARLDVFGLSPYMQKRDLDLTSDELKIMAISGDIKIKEKIALNVNTPKELLKILASDKKFSVKQCVAKNISTDAKILENLYNSAQVHGDIYDAFVLECDVAKNPSTPKSVLIQTSNSKNINVKYCTAQNKNCPIDIIRELARDSPEYVLLGIASNPSTPIDLLEKFADHESLNIRNHIAENPSTPVDILERYFNKKNDKINNLIGFHKISVNIHESVAKNPSAPRNILKILAEHSDFGVRCAVALNPSSQPETLSKLLVDTEWRVALAAICNQKIKPFNRLDFLDRIPAKPKAILQSATDSKFPSELIYELKIYLWYISLRKICHSYNRKSIRSILKDEISEGELREIYSTEIDFLQTNPGNSLLAQCLGSNNYENVFDMSWSRKTPSDIDALPEALSSLWIKDSKPGTNIRNDTAAVKITRSAKINTLLKTAQELKSIIVKDILSMCPDVRSSVYQDSDESRLLLQIETSAEALDVKFDLHSPEGIDRTTSMLSGPFFTSSSYPAPRGMFPVVQLDLRVAASIIGEILGDGLLQLWYRESDFFGSIRVVPRQEIDSAEITEFRSIESWDGNNFPLPHNWESDPDGQKVKVFSSYKSIGCMVQKGYLDIFLSDLQESDKVPTPLAKSIENFKKVCVNNNNSLAHIFGSFYPIQYSSAEIGKKVLISINSWGASGNAQIFYSIDKSGSATFEFFDSLR